ATATRESPAGPADRAAAAGRSDATDGSEAAIGSEAAGVGEAPSGIEPASIAEPGAEETDEVTVHRSLSPSRAADFMSCPLLYRFRVIDRLPEAPSAAAARGTLVHAVLERLFDEPAPGRTPAAAR